MSDQSSRAERNRKEAAKFSDLAKSASSTFLRGYYRRLAERYLALEGEWRPPGTQDHPISAQRGLHTTESHAPPP
jgi:hypothetical protein